MDIYVGNESTVSPYYDRYGQIFYEEIPERNQLHIQLSHEYVYTNMSMKNKDTWDFAHKYFGKRWFCLGWLLIPISVIPMLFVIGKGEDIIGTVGMVVMVIDLILLIAPIFPTERALKKIFDKDGNKRNGDIE